jgi:hypothetical protein
MVEGEKDEDDDEPPLLGESGAPGGVLRAPPWAPTTATYFGPGDASVNDGLAAALDDEAARFDCAVDDDGEIGGSALRGFMGARLAEAAFAGKNDDDDDDEEEEETRLGELLICCS